jgi:hypothetical protein
MGGQTMAAKKDAPKRRLGWAQLDSQNWLSVPGRYRLWRGESGGNVFVYRVVHSQNLGRGDGHWDALLSAKATLDEAKEYAQQHLDGLVD